MIDAVYTVTVWFDPEFLIVGATICMCQSINHMQFDDMSKVKRMVLLVG